jgi:hypothetical protein
MQLARTSASVAGAATFDAVASARSAGAVEAQPEKAAKKAQKTAEQAIDAVTDRWFMSLN